MFFKWRNAKNGEFIYDDLSPSGFEVDFYAEDYYYQKININAADSASIISKMGLSITSNKGIQMLQLLK
jgi:hypothetical protein